MLIFSEECFFKAGREGNRVQDASAQGGSESAGKAPGTVLTWLLAPRAFTEDNPPAPLPSTLQELPAPADTGDTAAWHGDSGKGKR